MGTKSRHPDDPDASLMLSVKAGNELAFRTLFQKHAGKLVGYVERFFHNRAQSEELVQEIFIKVYNARRRYEVRAKFSTWLYTIASRTCLNELRKQRKHAADEPIKDEIAAPGPEGQPSAQEIVEGKQMQIVVQQCLDEMPENQRLALVMSRFGGHSYSEVADIIGVSESAVKSLIFRATSSIKQAIEMHQASSVGQSMPVEELRT